MSLTFAFIIFVVGAVALGLFMRLWANRGRGIGSVIGPEQGEQELAMKEPYFRREVVEAKVKSLFPKHSPAEILRLLDTIPEPFGGPYRLHLAVLKLSNGDSAKLRRYIDAAGHDL